VDLPCVTSPTGCPDRGKREKDIAILQMGRDAYRKIVESRNWVMWVTIKQFLHTQALQKQRLNHNVLAIALVNKLARIAWAVLNKERGFACSKTEQWPPVQRDQP
jgi:hypothetical protein